MTQETEQTDLMPDHVYICAGCGCPTRGKEWYSGFGLACCPERKPILVALAKPDPVRDALVEALKYAHSQMQPFCDDTIVKKALKLAGEA